MSTMSGGRGSAMTNAGGLIEAFWAYERALMSNDLVELDRLFAPGPATLRGDANGLLVGHDQISAFRSARTVPRTGSGPWRQIVQTHVQAIDAEHALIIALTELAGGGRGQQTQLWARIATPDGPQWKITAAHVSVPAPALDSRIWRTLGTPLVPGSDEGPLAGQGVAVKDLFAVAGHRVGAGNPAWLASAPVESRHAWAVERLLGAGADVVGISRTDEFAYSLAGTNAHYGTPPNPKAPFRISGGSTSGSASAVSLGHATIGLGTDTGGSIRVPGAYQGLYGIRTTHGAIPMEGVLPLAPRFDTVGWLTRSASMLASVGKVLLPEGDGHRYEVADLAVVPELRRLAVPTVGAAIDAWLKPDAGALTWAPDLASWRVAFSTIQAAQAWQMHGEWLGERLDTLGPDVRARFEVARDLRPEDVERASEVAAAAREEIREVVGDRVLVLPSASSAAPRPDEDIEVIREATLRLTCLAGLGGLPAVNVPLTGSDGLPCGVSLVAAPGRDRALLDLAQRLAR